MERADRDGRGGQSDELIATDAASAGFALAAVRLLAVPCQSRNTVTPREKKNYCRAAGAKERGFIQQLAHGPPLFDRALNDYRSKRTMVGDHFASHAGAANFNGNAVGAGLVVPRSNEAVRRHQCLVLVNADTLT